MQQVLPAIESFRLGDGSHKSPARLPPSTTCRSSANPVPSPAFCGLCALETVIPTGEGGGAREVGMNETNLEGATEISWR